MEKEILERANQGKRARYVVRLVRAWGESIRKESRLPVESHHMWAEEAPRPTYDDCPLVTVTPS